jgi:hypothetical protein
MALSRRPQPDGAAGRNFAMTEPSDTTHQTSSPRSRRALLAGALGGLGAWAASAIGRATPAEAATGDPIRMGRINQAEARTVVHANTAGPLFRAVQHGTGNALRAVQQHSSQCSEGGAAILAQAGSRGLAVAAVTGGQGIAVSAYSPDECAVSARCPDGTAVEGRSVSQIGVWGRGRVGVSGQGSEIGIFASSGDKAGVFSGTVLINGVQDLVRQPDPPAPAASTLRLFARNSGSGKTQLCVRFPTGDVQVIATES